jgi:hypothetical protein
MHWPSNKRSRWSAIGSLPRSAACARYERSRLETVADRRAAVKFHGTDQRGVVRSGRRQLVIEICDYARRMPDAWIQPATELTEKRVCGGRAAVVRPPLGIG